MQVEENGRLTKYWHEGNRSNFAIVSGIHESSGKHVYVENRGCKMVKADGELISYTYNGEKIRIESLNLISPDGEKIYKKIPNQEWKGWLIIDKDGAVKMYE